MLFGLLMVFIIFTTSCSKPESRLIGKWVGSTGTIEFFRNKTGLMNPPREGIDLPANVRFIWRVDGRDIVTMIIDTPRGKTSFGKLLDNDTLIVEEDKFVKQK
jgi:hypothetical protein